MSKRNFKIIWMIFSGVFYTSNLFAYEIDAKGFMTFAYTQSDNESIYNRYIDDDGDYSSGTKVGLQLSSIISPKIDTFVQLLADGKSTTEIAQVLVVSKTTVSTYRKRIMQKLDIHDLPSLVKFALQNKMTN